MCPPMPLTNPHRILGVDRHVRDNILSAGRHPDDSAGFDERVDGRLKGRRVVGRTIPYRAEVEDVDHFKAGPERPPRGGVCSEKLVSVPLEGARFRRGEQRAGAELTETPDEIVATALQPITSKATR